MNREQKRQNNKEYYWYPWKKVSKLDKKVYRRVYRQHIKQTLKEMIEEFFNE